MASEKKDVKLNGYLSPAILDYRRGNHDFQVVGDRLVRLSCVTELKTESVGEEQLSFNLEDMWHSFKNEGLKLPLLVTPEGFMAPKTMRAVVAKQLFAEIKRNIGALLSVPFKQAGYVKSYMLDGAGRSKMPSFIQSRVYLDVEHMQGGVKQGWITFAWKVKWDDPMHTAVRCPLAMFPSSVINYICAATDTLAKELFAAYEKRVAEEERRVNAVRLTSPSYDPCEEALLELYAQADREREAFVAGNGVNEASPEPPADTAAAAKAKKPRKRPSKVDKEAAAAAAKDQAAVVLDDGSDLESMFGGPDDDDFMTPPAPPAEKKVKVAKTATLDGASSSKK